MKFKSLLVDKTAIQASVLKFYVNMLNNYYKDVCLGKEVQSTLRVERNDRKNYSDKENR